MILVHFVTFVAYVASVALKYIFDFIYLEKNLSEKAKDEYYVARTVSFVLLFNVQAVLIYIFWNLSAKVPNSELLDDDLSEEEDELDGTDTVLFQNDAGLSEIGVPTVENLDNSIEVVETNKTSLIEADTSLVTTNDDQEQ